ncbi:MAG: hypothetical protein LBM59_00955 [Ruminococcus sp.]|jgi:hypothetical protein|nr:hypothetical protein [Ruminococcus sp.]
MSSTAMAYFSPYKDLVKEYCDENGLDYNKLIACHFGRGKDDFYFAHSHPNGLHDGSRGLLDDTPNLGVLWVEINKDGSLKFVETEHTREFISA